MMLKNEVKQFKLINLFVPNATLRFSDVSKE